MLSLNGNDNSTDESESSSDEQSDESEENDDVEDEEMEDEEMEGQEMDMDEEMSDGWLDLSLENRLRSNEVVESDQEEPEGARIEQITGQEGGSTATQHVWTHLELTLLRLDQIKNICREHDLGVTANKPALIQRILDFQNK